jgi:hypothetical protein
MGDSKQLTNTNRIAEIRARLEAATPGRWKGVFDRVWAGLNIVCKVRRFEDAELIGD